MLSPRFHSRIADVPAEAWDRLRGDDQPFLSHAFLHALETTGCIRPEWGWQAHHLGLYERERLVAASPLYLKGNSHGEFVFDWSWAAAWERAGGAYYPKLLAAVPYSPVPGPRLLAGDGAQAPLLRRALAEAMRAEADRLGLSSVHANFLDAAACEAFDDDWLARSDVQFHWHNRDYRDFADFLDALKPKKRKNIRQERARVAAAGIGMEWCDGASLDRAAWRQIHALYLSTFDAKGNHAALTAAFFSRLREFGDRVQVALARSAEGIAAMALFLRDADTLYGRYWGSRLDVPGLHFELCYYRAIEYAIAAGLRTVQPGAQGEHKLARGFVPVRTHSRHYLADPRLRDAVARALKHEHAGMDAYLEELAAHTPYAVHWTA